jgi:acetyltransferase-like isoleucine patch superfamily enzyme
VSIGNNFRNIWSSFWARYAGYGKYSRAAAWFASWWVKPHKGQVSLSSYYSGGYIAHSARLSHSNLTLGDNVYVGDRVIVYENDASGEVSLGDRVRLLRDTIIETGKGGKVIIGDDTYIHARCQINSYLQPVQIGKGVLIAANCALYPHDHGLVPGLPIRTQPLESRGPIVIEDNVWLGTGVVVLGGVTIGEGAVIGAGSVVTKSVPSEAIAVGVPARVVKMRADL